MKRFEIFFGVIKVPVDFMMTVLAFLAAYELRLITEPIKGIAKPIDYSTLPTITEYLQFSFKAAALLVIIFAIGKAYILKSTTKFSKEAWKSTLLGGVWIMAIITFFFFNRTFPFSRLAILYSWTLSIFFIILGRALINSIQKGFIKIGIGKRNILFIGNNKITEELSSQLSKNSSYKILGLIGKEGIKGTVKRLGSISQLEYIIKKRKIDEIILTEDPSKEMKEIEILELCNLKHITYRFVPNLVDVQRTNIDIETIAAIPIITLKPTPLDGWGKVSKRILDIIGAVFGFIIFSPILLITAIAIKLDSKGPILFTKLDNGSPVKRVGQEGKLFKFYKFRSMQPNTHNLRYTELAEKNLRTSGPLIKIEKDPRVTKIGNFIRKFSIDELPQLWNVLIGNMSLVGPRPHLPEEVAKYKKHHKFVLTIKPGLTGLPQINGRSDLDFEKEMKLDRYYIENWSILLDIKIIFKTIGVILKGYKE